MLEKVLRLPAVIEATGKSRSEIYDDMARGVFPQKVSLSDGGHSVGWLESEIIAWQEARIAARDTEAA